MPIAQTELTYLKASMWQDKGFSQLIDQRGTLLAVQKDFRGISASPLRGFQVAHRGVPLSADTSEKYSNIPHDTIHFYLSLPSYSPSLIM